MCADFSRRHYLAGRGNVSQDTTAVEALLGHHYAQTIGADVREGRHRLWAEGRLHGAYFRLGKRLADLMVEPMSFDRIGKLGNSDTMKARLKEEVRLVDLAQSTWGRYTDMGVFNAVVAH